MLSEVQQKIQERSAEGKPTPKLATVIVGDNPASVMYVGMKHKDAEHVGIATVDHRLPESSTTEEVVSLVRSLNEDVEVSGILVQQPFPRQVDTAAVVEATDPAKDVDGFHPISAGRLLLGQPGIFPCTPVGVMVLLERAGIDVAGMHAVILGRGNLVGKPLALLMLRANATVTVCHTKTRDLHDITRSADILVGAMGQAWFIKPDMVKEGAVVVDVGTATRDGKLTGDVDPGVREVAGWVTPVPGGVGPMTRAMLMSNTLHAEMARRP